ncbi:MAG TPA: DNA-formamidopyrimidine glycosylase family protein [Actinomycetota bacterium]|nr:DNA-formamidopyrimidine glycosylase family protein [Actinomycetota bacterium]
MPEGHLVHRHASELVARFEGTSIEASSPQGRFADGAAAIDGFAMSGAEAYGKHLFVRFGGDDGSPPVLHVHLGRSGLWLWGKPGTVPRGSVRLRLATPSDTADLIAPLVCELGDLVLRDDVVDRLGPDPLRADADPAAARDAIRRSAQPIGALLLDQSVIAGLGNVLRAEILNLVGIHPSTPGSELDDADVDDIWSCAVDVMRIAEREGRIITRRPDGVDPAELDEIDGRFVYGRERCGRCGTPLEHLTIGGRAIAACPRCQPLARPERAGRGP